MYQIYAPNIVWRLVSDQTLREFQHSDPLVGPSIEGSEWSKGGKCTYLFPILSLLQHNVCSVRKNQWYMYWYVFWYKKYQVHLLSSISISIDTFKITDILKLIHDCRKSHKTFYCQFLIAIADFIALCTYCVHAWLQMSHSICCVCELNGAVLLFECISCTNSRC